MKSLRYFLCGLAMGAADTVPGVSGGTIAFITGIYTQLLDGIKSININFFKLLFKGEIKKALALVPWSFGIPLVLGIGIAIFSLANVVVFLLENHTEFIWSFFFGLILASLYILGKEVTQIKANKCNNIFSLILFVIGALFALWITFATPVALTPSPLITFVSGFIAICAMILPGISGSFILVIMGQYHYYLEAVSQLNFSVIIIFIMGAMVGLLSISRLVSFCLRKFYKSTLSFLTGILAGSLALLFPFKNIQNQNLSSITLTFLLIGLGILIPIVINYYGKKLDSSN